MLDREHEGTIRCFSRSRTSGKFARAWESTVDGGDVASAYRATMGYPAIGEALETRLFGGVHMSPV